MTTYPHEFYAQRDEATRYSAEIILGLLLKQIPPVRSAIDIGCGVGTWLSVLERHGVEHIQGCDGPWVEKELMVIHPERFQATELSKGIPAVTRRYDLAISLEVAEHLAQDRAIDFVNFLTDLSDTVLFSAAIPGQGGTGHVNEQWPKYWSNLFAMNGYQVMDTIRPAVWQDATIPVWYRQNTLLFMKSAIADDRVMDLVHPDLYLSHTQLGVKGSFKALRQAVHQYVSRH